MTRPVLRLAPARRAGLVFAVVALLAGSSPARAAWVPEGNPICVLQPSHQNGPAAIGTFNGALVFWSDTRAGAEDLYARFIDSTGTLVSGEIPIAVQTSFQNGPACVFDGLLEQAHAPLEVAAGGRRPDRDARVPGDERVFEALGERERAVGAVERLVEPVAVERLHGLVVARRP